MKNFNFRKALTVTRRRDDNSVEKFSTYGMTRIEFDIDPKNCNIGNAKCVFLLDPAVEIKPGDIISDGNQQYLLIKVSRITDFEDTLLAYRATGGS